MSELNVRSTSATDPQVQNLNNDHKADLKPGTVLAAQEVANQMQCFDGGATALTVSDKIGTFPKPSEGGNVSGAEQGHGTATSSATGSAPSAAQLEFERKAKEREDVIKQNAAIKESNRGLNGEIGKAQTAMTHLSALANVVDISASFTRGELNDFANSLTLSPETKAAARWLLAQSDADLAALGLRKGEGGVTKESINAVLGSLGIKIADLQSQIRSELPVPGEPPPPPAPTTSQNGSTGTPTTGGTPSPTSSGATGAGANNQTGEEFRAKSLKNSNAVPPFSTNAATGEGRMQDGLKYTQDKLEALQADLTEAAARGDQGAIALINAEIAKYQAGLSALMQMLKQMQEMQSNMSKMFSEMASSAIRNMR